MSLRLAFIVIAALLAYAAHALSQARVDLRPAMTAIPSSSANGVSFAWFYDAGTRTVVLCRAGAAAGEPLDCRAQATLP